MKNLILALIVCSSSPVAFAAEKSLNVTVNSVSKTNLEISYASKVLQTSTCFLAATSLELQAAARATRPGTLDKVGSITAKVEVLPESMCLMSAGFNHGTLSLSRGVGLPKLNDGLYNLVLNGESYGILVVDGDNAVLEN